MRLTFIGAGTMAEAMIRSTLEQQVVRKNDITATDIIPARLDYIRQKYGINSLSDNLVAVHGADIAILSIKPQDMPLAAKELKGKLAANQTLLSIMAGVSIKSIEDSFGHKRVIRVMPNTPAQIGAGMSIWIATTTVTEAHKKAVAIILKTLGDEIYVDDEKYIDMATALSGSGPAYVFLFIEALVDAGVHMGLPRDVSKRLVIQTVIGSARLVKETGLHTAELKDMVSSPGGTTVEGILELEKGQFRTDIIKAVLAAYEKAKHFSRQDQMGKG